MTAHGKIVYLEIPSDDPQASASFYRTVFGWRIRTHEDGTIAFDDTSTEVSGAWRRDRPRQQTAGTLVYVCVDDVAASVQSVVAAGGTLVQDIGGDPGEITARFLDPQGNLFGLYQEPG